MPTAGCVRYTVRPLAILAIVLVCSSFPGCGEDPGGSHPTAPGDSGQDSPTVRNLVATNDGFRPASFVVTWDAPEAAAPGLAVGRYLVAVSATGPITTLNWDSATIIDVVGHSGPSYARAYDATMNGITPGANLHLAVRPWYTEVGDTLALAWPQAPPASLQHTVTDTAYVNGTVIDDTGAALPGVDVVTIPGLLRATTDAAGRYRLGPISDSAEIHLQTESADTVSAADADDAWFDFYTDPFRAGEGDPVDITLITRYPINIGSIYLDRFTHYIYLCLGRQYTNWPRVWKWEDYPLSVYVPEDTITVQNRDGTWATSYPHQVMREAMATWSRGLGYEAFVEVAAPQDANLVCEYRDLGSGLRGRVETLAPAGAFLTEAPRSVAVVLNSAYEPLWWESNRDQVLITASHELGHALGHWGHSLGVVDASGERIPDLLMTYSPGESHAPHLWDLRVIHAVNNMPQGCPITHYEWTKQPDGNGAIDEDFPPLE